MFVWGLAGWWGSQLCPDQRRTGVVCSECHGTQKRWKGFSVSLSPSLLFSFLVLIVLSPFSSLSLSPLFLFFPPSLPPSVSSHYGADVGPDPSPLPDLASLPSPQTPASRLWSPGSHLVPVPAWPPTSGPHLLRPPTQCLPPWDPTGTWGPERRLKGLSRTKTRPPGPAPRFCPQLCLEPKLRSWARVFRRWWLGVPCLQARDGTGGGPGRSGKEGQLDPTFGRGPLVLPPHSRPLLSPTSLH